MRIAGSHRLLATRDSNPRVTNSLLLRRRGFLPVYDHIQSRLGRIRLDVHQEALPAGGPPQWGNPNIVRERLGDAGTDLTFDRDALYAPGLSPEHVISLFERTAGPMIKLVESLKSEPARLTEFRSAFRAIIDVYYRENQLHQSYLMTRATKK